MKKRYIFIFAPILAVLLMALICVAYYYYYLITRNVISIGWNKTNLGPSWGYAKKYAMKSEFSRIVRGKGRVTFNEVYCDDEFSFKEAGVLKGSFILPKDTFFYGLSYDIYIPELITGYGTIDEYSHDALVQIPATVIFEWDGKDGKRKRAESSLDRYFEDKNTEGSARNYTYDGKLYFKYVPIPRNKKIDYTLIYDKGTYLKDSRGYPLLRTFHRVPDNSERGYDLKTVDKSELLETEPKFWKAHFVVGEGTIKGKPDRSRKPAKD